MTSKRSNNSLEPGFEKATPLNLPSLGESALARFLSTADEFVSAEFPSKSCRSKLNDYLMCMLRAGATDFGLREQLVPIKGPWRKGPR